MLCTSRELSKALTRFILWPAAVGLLAGVAVGAFVFWLETPRGALYVSKWLTAKVAREVPGTEVTVGRIKYHWPLSFTAESVRWSRAGQFSIAQMKEVVLTTRLSSWLAQGGVAFNQIGRVSRLDLAELDTVLADGQWKMKGFVSGHIELKGVAPLVQKLDLELVSQHPGGDLASEFLQKLIQMMPEEDVRRKFLAAALSKKELFHFNSGKVNISTVGDLYIIHVVLDGDHLLDITIRVPIESIGVLESLLKETS